MAIDEQRRDFLKWGALVAAVGASPARGSAKAKKPTSKKSVRKKLPKRVVQYLRRLYAEDRRAYAFRDDYRGGFGRWQKDARPALCRLIGLDKIATLADGHEPKVDLEEPEDQGQYTRQRGRIETEPDVVIPFWLLKPSGQGPFPLALFPHGHDPIGHDTSAGVYHSEAHRRKSLANDRDVTVQAVKKGFLAIAPATRGFSVDGVPDVANRHGGRDCRSQVMHCLMVGRTAIGERVWDVQRIMDWASALTEIDAKRLLMMGNSGGGVVTIYAAACDKRVTIAVPSCSFCSFVSREGRIYHCDCDMVPGILEFGEFYDIAGLIAPRRLLIVNGRKDTLFEASDVTRAVNRVRTIYKAAGRPECFQYRWGSAGHRFYKDLMWPFVLKAMKTSGPPLQG